MPLFLRQWYGKSMELAVIQQHVPALQGGGPDFNSAEATLMQIDSFIRNSMAFLYHYCQSLEWNFVAFISIESRPIPIALRHYQLLDQS